MTSRLSPLLIGFTVALLGSHAAAQVAPTGGHYGARASDTGHNGRTSGGAYAASVPLDVPPARGGLPIPLQIVSGNRGFGAAGVGWDVPLSYVHQETSFAHHRPSISSTTSLQLRDLVTLVLPGGVVQMTRKGTDWVGRNGSTELTLRREGGGWKVFDGGGLTYTFTQYPELVGSGLWLLTSISGSGGGSLEVAYDIAMPPVPDAPVPPMTIDLKQVRYDPHASSAGCFKHEVNLVYDPPESTPQGFSLLGERVLMRQRKLSRVEVASRATCGATAQRLRSYTLSYQPDRDKQQWRLSTVTMSGRDGTPEASSVMPIATYTYGTASYNGGTTPVLRYQKTQSIPLPAGVSLDQIAGTVEDSSVNPPISGTGSSAWQSLTDVTGDGRADLVYKQNGVLWVARNLAGVSGTTTLGVAAAQLTDPVLTQGAFEKRSATSKRFSGSSGVTNAGYLWRQAIDVNGDGRIDLVDASEQAYQWVVYLNTPGTSLSGVKWVRRVLDIKPLYNRLASRGLKDGYLPLSRRYTGHDIDEKRCWVYHDGHFDNDASNMALCYANGDPHWIGPEQTYTEWELQDINGDGYPDFVYNSSAIGLVGEGPPPVLGAWTEGTHWAGQEWVRVIPLDPRNSVQAVLNIRGLYFSDGAPAYNPFSAEFTLRKNTLCGVGKWVADASLAMPQRQVCALADVNGDGLIDRIEEKSVRLGMGTAFETVAMTLPDYLGRQQSGLYQCGTNVSPSTFFSSEQTAALRDVTGDGIPDFVRKEGSTWWVHAGTGAGFAPRIAIDLPGFTLSIERENCDGSISWTQSGLFDIDGDGKPEVVSLAGANLDVYQLAGGSTPRTPEAGRIVRVDNGYGAATTVTYRSAKEDGTTLHQVPSAELVVTAIETTGTQGLGGSLAVTRYAYGGAEQFFDPGLDAFTMPAYRRSVELHTVGGREQQATLVDTYGVTAFSNTMTQSQRFGRYLRAGQVSDTTLLAGAFANDPWALLSINAATDARRVGQVHYEWDSRVVIEPSTEFCWDMMFPYDFDLSASSNFGSNGYDACAAHGFLFKQSSFAWRGSAAPPSTNNIQSRWTVRSVDAWGRIERVDYENDLFRGDDDVCVTTTYASFAGQEARVLGAPRTRVTMDCTKGVESKLLAQQEWEYDQLPAGNVSRGLVTGYQVQRRTADTGQLIDTVRGFDMTYDAAGNPIKIVKVREDGAVRSVTQEYDPFGLRLVHTITNASDTPALEAFATYDPISLDLSSSTDENGTARGATYDGFGRQVLATIQPPGAPLGALSSRSYPGFTGPGLLERRVVVKELVDPVAPSAIATATGRTATTWLDELGRARLTQVELGADYANEILIVGARTYDGLGRVVFESDAFPASQNAATAYGTTHYFSADGSPRLDVRGHGPQGTSTVPDPAAERFPTLYTHTFSNHVESMSVQDAASLTSGSPQNGVVRDTGTSAIGRMLYRSTWKSGTRLEHEAFAYDRLGNQSSVIRYQNAAAGTDPVQWGRQYDSLGQLVQLYEPGNAPQVRTFSKFGELKKVEWAPPSEPTHSIVRQYDGLSRVTHFEEQNNGVADAETVANYFYDQGQQLSPAVTPTYMLGRLALAKTPTSGVSLSYDAFGWANARTFADQFGGLYIERHSFHADGSRASLELNLPDNGYQPERVTYGYDSAGRARSMLFANASSTQNLFTASNVDPFGRLRNAKLGASDYSASYANIGRRLLQSVSASSPTGVRNIAFTSYDSLGREVSRSEQGPLAGTLSSFYDALGRLSISGKVNAGAVQNAWGFGYDPLGNIVSLNDLVGTADATLSYQTNDRDRICRIGYGGSLGGTACNVEYDSFGNILYQPTRTGYNKLAYFNSGAVRRVDNDLGATATFRYDAFGGVEQLDLTSAGELRTDRNYGAFIKQRYQRVGQQKAYYLSRQFPGPGVMVSRRGPTGRWVYQLGESKGTRFTTDENGNFLQDLEYQPYGETKSVGAAPATAEYSTEQWNAGEALSPFGLVSLGARLYDPVIGRFLSRDPLRIPNTAGRSNPYAFAHNDPVNFADPTGLSPETELPQPLPFPPGGGGGSGGGGGGGGNKKPAFKPYKLTDEEITQYLRGIPITEDGRNAKLVVEMVSRFTEDDPQWWDNVARACKGNLDCAMQAINNTPLSRADQDYNDRIDRLTPMVQTAFVLGMLPGQLAWFAGMAMAGSDEDLPVAMLGFRMRARAGAIECPGGVCTGNPQCFTAGTPVSTYSGPTPIETVQPGDRVRSLDQAQCTRSIEPESCRAIELEMDNPYGYPDKLSARFLRTRAWIAEHGVELGREMPLVIDELFLDGPARVTAITECTLQPGPGCLVTGTVTHQNRSVLRLRFVESAETLEPTTLHPLWSQDRAQWVKAGSLQVGERLRTEHGTVTIAAIEPLAGAQQVFNLEVADVHTYLVSELHIYSHNGCTAPDHHLMTNKNTKSTARGGPWTPKFEPLAQKAGMTLADDLNIVGVPGHKGPHPEAYHAAVYDRLVDVTEGLEGQAYTDAFKSELEAIGVEAATPGSPLNELLKR